MIMIFWGKWTSSLRMNLILISDHLKSDLTQLWVRVSEWASERASPLKRHGAGAGVLSLGSKWRFVRMATKPEEGLENETESKQSWNIFHGPHEGAGREQGSRIVTQDASRCKHTNNRESVRERERAQWCHKRRSYCTTHSTLARQEMSLDVSTLRYVFLDVDLFSSFRSPQSNVIVMAPKDRQLTGTDKGISAVGAREFHVIESPSRGSAVLLYFTGWWISAHLSESCGSPTYNSAQMSIQHPVHKQSSMNLIRTILNLTGWVLFTYVLCNMFCKHCIPWTHVWYDWRTIGIENS